MIEDSLAEERVGRRKGTGWRNGKSESRRIAKRCFEFHGERRSANASLELIRFSRTILIIESVI